MEETGVPSMEQLQQEIADKAASQIPEGSDPVGVLKTRMVQAAVDKLMADHKVPAWQLLQALKMHQEEMRAHQETRKLFESERARHAEQLQSADNAIQGHQDTLAKWQDAADHLLSIDHLKGDPGDSPEVQDVVDAVLPHLPPPEPVNHEEIASRVLGMIPPPESLEVETLDREKLFKEFVSRIQKERLIDVSHIKNAESFLFNGKKYKIEELMRGAGGGGFAVQIPTGVVDGSNKTFVFTTEPSVIVLDNGNFMNKVSKDGTANWTGTTNVVLNQAPNFNIYGF